MNRYCTNCGSALWPGHSGCSRCGAHQVPLPQQPAYDPQAAYAANLDIEIAEKTRALQDLHAQFESVEDAIEIQSFGFYRPHYDLPASSDYKAKLDRVRGSQKALLRSGKAWESDTRWTVDGSVKRGRELVEQQAKLMLRAFNGECDVAIASVRYDNVKRLEQRIHKSCESINKLGHAQRVQITTRYFQLKLAELRVMYEYQEKLQEEREVEREQRARLREAEKVRKETEKAQREAEKEEQRNLAALARARSELAVAAPNDQAATAKLGELVATLEARLADALDRKAKAIARAQLTRSGHVYVLSNVGAFGENVYKLGMTRRLEPLDRVRELGDASVPFLFDVHALIYSEDAPALESALHRRFHERRLNLVNNRREFFHVTLEEIMSAVADLHGHVTFLTTHPAAEYRKTLAQRADVQGNSA